MPWKDANSQRTILLNYIKQLPQINGNYINFAVETCWLAQKEAQVPTYSSSSMALQLC
jgi:hypothetical protein